jgi:4,5-DOPA dioxygenase extradiol
MPSVEPSFKPSLAESSERMPVLFLGHGNPMNAIEDNEFSRAWQQAGQALPRPQAILCISAHWQTRGTEVTAMDKPKTIHDFGGFPQELFAKEYPAPGSPALARLVQETVTPVLVGLDQKWGLDHGAWSVLCRLYPGADVPVVQLSMDYTQPPAFHYALGQALKPLRRRGVLIVGSGNIVHNLRQATWQEGAYDWAVEFDAKIAQLIAAGDHQSVVHYERLGKSASLSVPTNEHYLPLLYALGLQEEGETLSFFAAKVTYGSLSMRSLRIG